MMHARRRAVATCVLKMSPTQSLQNRVPRGVELRGRPPWTSARGLQQQRMNDPDPGIPDDNPIQTEQVLGDIAYPAHRNALVEHLRGAGAPPSVCRAIARLPDREFASPIDVSEALAALAPA